MNGYEKKIDCSNVVECLNVGIGYPVRCVFAISFRKHQLESEHCLFFDRFKRNKILFVSIGYSVCKVIPFQFDGVARNEKPPKLRWKDTKFQKLCCIAHTIHIFIWLSSVLKSNVLSVGKFNRLTGQSASPTISKRNASHVVDSQSEIAFAWHFQHALTINAASI